MADLLAGIRVLDLTTVLAGPFATYQLSLMGAEVIKVEHPAGDVSRELGADAALARAGMGASFLAQNAGKQSVTVDLKTPNGQEVLRRLLTGADVLIENMRPGVLGRLGFDESRLREINPRLVYCALSGFGANGPLSGRPAYDQIVQGLAGMADVTGEPGGDPLRVGFPICDTLGGMAAAFAVCAGLIGRARTGRGCVVDVSMLDTALTALGWVVSDYLVGEQTPGRLGNDNATSAPSGTFRCSDGALNIAANTDAQFELICTVLERPDLLSDPRFATRADRKVHRQALTEELEYTLKTQDAQYWERSLGEAGVPAGRVLTVPDALAQPQVSARALVHRVAVTGSQPPRQVDILGSGIHIDGKPPRPAAAPPTLGQHTDTVLHRLGYTDTDITELRKTKAI